MMDSWIDPILTNAALAGALACLVFLVTRLWRNPHAARALWLCVLLKLIFPPLLRIPMPDWAFRRPEPVVTEVLPTPDLAPLAPAPAASEPSVREMMPDLAGEGPLPFPDAEEQSEPLLVEALPSPPGDMIPLPVAEAQPEMSSIDLRPEDLVVEESGIAPIYPEPMPAAEVHSELPPIDQGPAQVAVVISPIVASSEPVPPVPAPAMLASPVTAAGTATPFPWRLLVVCAWGMGSAVWMGLSLSRMIRFARLVRQMRPADDEIQVQAAKLGGELGLRRIPEVRVVEGVIPPLLWAFVGRGVVVLPGALARGMEPEERGMLLLHEMAHLKRRDHWTRRLEWLVLAAYWWHPAAWWARRELQTAEELCCDAAVLRAAPEGARAYGRALLRTMEFLSDGCLTRAPALASGIGNSATLMKRRMRMILQCKKVDRLGRPASLAVAAFGVLVLSAAAPQPPGEAPPPTPAPAVEPSTIPPLADVAPTVSVTREATPAGLAKSTEAIPDGPLKPGLPIPAAIMPTPDLPPEVASSRPLAEVKKAESPDLIPFEAEAAPRQGSPRLPAPALEPADDRVSALENRLQRLEAMIERLAEAQEPKAKVAAPMGADSMGMMGTARGRGTVPGMGRGAAPSAKKAKLEALVGKMEELSTVREEMIKTNERYNALVRETNKMAEDLGISVNSMTGNQESIYGATPAYSNNLNSSN